jgi:hypothetical protein
MANLSLYISGQTEQNDVAEFFQKGLMNAGENPIAFFDGVFYESHQERVGNIAFQDYLVYSDKAVYLWARGSSKDFLDRFDLGSVSVNSRNKDHDFATVNLKVRREGKEPVYVIFDMVELREAELIVRMHTVIESIIEQYMGLNYRSTLPDDVSSQVLHASRSICVPRVISLRLDAPGQAQQPSNIGYGQDLLEQYKATIGYAAHEKPPQPAGYPGVQPPPGAPSAAGGEQYPEAFSPADVFKKLESMLPGEPGSIKKVADSIKDMIGEVPMKLRDQFRSDMQHVPGMLSALNELLTNIADNPQAERFVMNIVKTAVRNDGMFGSVGKLIKISSNLTAPPKKKTAKPSPKSAHSGADETPQHERYDTDDDFDRPVRRKKITIKNDEPLPMHPDIFSIDEDDVKPVRESRPQPKAGRDDADNEDIGAVRRKKISVKAPEEEAPDLVKHMMSMDDVVSEISVPEPAEEAKPFVKPAENGQAAAVSRKIRIVSETPAAEVPDLEIQDDAFLDEVLSTLDAPADEALKTDASFVDVSGEKITEPDVSQTAATVKDVSGDEERMPEAPSPEVTAAEAKRAELNPSESTVSEKPAGQHPSPSAPPPSIPAQKPDFTGKDISRKKFHVPGKHGRR